MGRRLREGERNLISAMLNGEPHSGLLSNLEACAVEDMQDGAMGSIRFCSDRGRRLSRIRSGTRRIGARVPARRAAPIGARRAKCRFASCK